MRTILSSSALVAAGALTAAIGPAQTRHVFPVEATTAEGETSVSDYTGGLPWWSNPDFTTPNAQNFRMQLISDLPGSMRGNITKMSYRRDGNELAGFSLEQFTAEIQVTLSTANTTAATAVQVFGNNAGSDAVTVVARRRINFPLQMFHGTFPEPFGYDLVFDQPFPYDGAQGSLCIDVVHWENDLMHPIRLTPLVVAADAMTSSTESATQKNVSRCFGPNPYSPPIDFNMEMSVDDSSGIPMLNMYAWRQYGQHHSRGFLIASSGLVSPGIAVPPSPAGIVGCGMMQVDFSRQIFWTFSSSNDYGQIRWPTDPSRQLFSFPYDPATAGWQFYSQELNFDVHTQIYTASNWVRKQVPVYLGSTKQFPMRTVYAAGPGSHTALTGTIGTLGVGPVTQYELQ